VIRLAERVLLAIGLFSAAWYGTAHLAAAREQAALSRELDAAREEVRPDVADVTVPATLPARALVGRIEVPRLKMSAVAREGVDVRTLRGSVGHVPGTALPGDAGNAAFAAHRDTFFAPLRDIRAGDEVVVTTATAVHRYAVVRTQVVEPSDVSVLRPSDGRTLTLVTCYPFDYVGSAPKRFIVQAALKHGV
jgi:sortase A